MCYQCSCLCLHPLLTPCHIPGHWAQILPAAFLNTDSTSNISSHRYSPMASQSTNFTCCISEHSIHGYSCTSCIISPSLPCTKVTEKHLKIMLFLHPLPLKYVINVAVYALSPWTHILEHEAQILPAAFKNIDFTSNILKHRYPQHPSSIQHPTASILLITFQNTISIPR